VPHFGARCGNQNEATQVARQWLAQRGLTIFECWADDRIKLSTILDAYSRQNPGAPIILHGEAAMKGREINHAVVMLNGEISYDPSGAGVSGPAIQANNEGSGWWMEVLVPASAGEAGTAETPKSGSVHEHAVPNGETPITSEDHHE
jgi:hypothetical protein